MELKDFISTTIISICEGIAKAKEHTNDKYKNCIVAPGRINGYEVGNRPDERYNIDFEICVTTEKSKDGKTGGGLKLKIFDMGADIEKNTTNKNGRTDVNRIKFSVPYLPQGFLVPKISNK